MNRLENFWVKTETTESVVAVTVGFDLACLKTATFVYMTLYRPWVLVAVIMMTTFCTADQVQHTIQTLIDMGIAAVRAMNQLMCALGNDMLMGYRVFITARLDTTTTSDIASESDDHGDDDTETCVGRQDDPVALFTLAPPVPEQPVAEPIVAASDLPVVVVTDDPPASSSLSEKNVEEDNVIDNDGSAAILLCSDDDNDKNPVESGGGSESATSLESFLEKNNSTTEEVEEIPFLMEPEPLPPSHSQPSLSFTKTRVKSFDAANVRTWFQTTKQRAGIVTSS